MAWQTDIFFDFELQPKNNERVEKIKLKKSALLFTMRFRYTVCKIKNILQVNKLNLRPSFIYFYKKIIWLVSKRKRNLLIASVR